MLRLFQYGGAQCWQATGSPTNEAATELDVSTTNKAPTTSFSHRGSLARYERGECYRRAGSYVLRRVLIKRLRLHEHGPILSPPPVLESMSVGRLRMLEPYQADVKQSTNNQGPNDVPGKLCHNFGRYIRWRRHSIPK